MKRGRWYAKDERRKGTRTDRERERRRDNTLI